MATQSFSLDVTPAIKAPAIRCTASQYDVGRTLIVSLTDGSYAYEIPDGADVYFNERKPDGNVVTAACEWSGSDVTIVTTQQMTAVAGLCMCELQIISGDEVLNSRNFLLQVEKSPLDDGTESASVIAQIEAAIESAEAAAQTAAEAAEAAAESAQEASESASGVSVALTDVIPDGAGPHNSIYRGEYLGDTLTEDQLDAIENGTFEGIFIGDYWVIDGVTYRVAGLDYFYNAGSTVFAAHHAVIVPDTCLVTGVQMHSESGNSVGYTGTDLYTTVLPEVLETIEAAFGEDYILSHKDNLCSAVNSSNGLPSRTWCDSRLELMTERMVYGAAAVGSGSYGVAAANNLILTASQLPLFVLRHDLTYIRASYWLQDTVGIAYYAYVHSAGPAYFGSGTGTAGVRPYFCIGRT